MSLSFVSLCLFGPLAHAEIYMCKDATGRTLTADRVLPECADRAIRKYGKTGMVHKDIPAPPTPEQRREAIAQHDKQKAELAAAEAKRKDDQAFLARFPSEKRIEDERTRATIYIKEKIAEQGKEVYMVDKANDRNNADKARQALYQSQLMLANINLKYDQLLARYREIETEQ